MFKNFMWLNEPKKWSVENETLTVHTDANTDFWRETHYGFVRDSGHFFGVESGGDFTAQVHIEGRFEELYDQAGMMVRIDEKNWLKASVEINDEELVVSSVLTVGVSDWSVSELRSQGLGFWLRVTVADGVLRLQVSMDGKLWPLVRLAPFPAASSYKVGPMCCTPERAGLEVKFSDFRIGPPNNKDLHDLS